MLVGGEKWSGGEGEKRGRSQTGEEEEKRNREVPETPA